MEENESAIRNTCLVLLALCIALTITLCQYLYGDKNSEVPETAEAQKAGMTVWHHQYSDTRAAQAEYLEGRAK